LTEVWSHGDDCDEDRLVNAKLKLLIELGASVPMYPTPLESLRACESFRVVRDLDNIAARETRTVRPRSALAVTTGLRGALVVCKRTGSAKAHGVEIQRREDAMKKATHSQFRVPFFQEFVRTLKVVGDVRVFVSSNDVVRRVVLAHEEGERTAACWVVGTLDGFPPLDSWKEW
jgi:hypothetical protein